MCLGEKEWRCGDTDAIAALLLSLSRTVQWDGVSTQAELGRWIRHNSLEKRISGSVRNPVCHFWRKNIYLVPVHKNEMF